MLKSGFLKPASWNRSPQVRTLQKTISMYRFLLLFLLSGASILAYSQDIRPAEKGVTYGAGTTDAGAISVNQLEESLVKNKFSGKISGTVTDVCQEKGCWMKLERNNGEKVMVKFKDYGFFMPKNIVGKEVVLEGEALVKEVSVKQLQHYAKDAGKSEEEIKTIKKPKKELQFVASGVLVR